ncbi:MAG TPA: cysteine--tRNA ligase [Devosia sp.]|jgi:cysteinyl-tRNA synthetase|nr:cysteine--tRNA ligase [Devosia sp.]
MASDLKIRLHNTLTRTKEDFVPLDPANVRMYVCGPTVYDFAHIGNARPAIVFDVLFRLLRHVYGESHVTYVRNITDVDDKINARAARDFPDLPLNDAIRKVTEPTAAQYQKDTTALGCLPPTVQPRATENIPQMQAIIGKLIASRHAYEAAQVGEVLFDVSSMPDYGALSGRDLENNLAGARVEVDAHKRNAADFVLWKKSSEHEPGWDSPWGRGRPGWHIECSAMSERYLGQVFDIHAGGLDLIFPHHENELAQSRCAHGTEVMARYWLHNGFLQVEGQKMSKSLGNFVTIHELLETDKFGGRSWPGEVLRLAMLMTHYREPIDFTVVRLNEAEERLRGWQRVASKAKGTGTVDPSVLEALSDDLGFHRASVAMDVIARKANRGVDTAVECLAATLKFFGFPTDSLIADAEVFDSSRIADAVNARLAALNAKDFAKADEIRAALLAEGIQLMDSKNDAGERVTTWEIKR